LFIPAIINKGTRTLMKKPRFILAFIVLVTALAVIIDWPTVPVKFNVGGFKVDTVLKGPDMDFAVGNIIRVERDLDVKLGLDLQGGTDLTLLTSATKP
jgi:hypothetical protein